MTRSPATAAPTAEHELEQGAEVVNVYRFWVAEGHEYVHTPDDARRRLHQDAGVPHNSSWTPPAVELVDADDAGKRLLFADSPDMDSMLAFRPPAWGRVRDQLDPWGEVLALDSPQAPLLAFNALNVVDAFDDDHADADRLFSNGRIFFIRRWAFHLDRLPVQGVFRIPDFLDTILCTEATAEQLRRQKISGLHLQLVWSAEHGPADIG